MILNIFLALLWASAVVAALLLGALSIAAVTRWDVSALTRASGIALRIVATCATIALLIGAPLAWMGMA